MKDLKLINKQLLIGTWSNSNSTISFNPKRHFLYKKGKGMFVIKGNYVWINDLDIIKLKPLPEINNLFASNEKILKIKELTQIHFSFWEDDLLFNYRRKEN